MLFEVYAQKKRAPETGVPVMPMEETLLKISQNLQVVASKNQTAKKASGQTAQKASRGQVLTPEQAALAKSSANLVGAAYTAHKKELAYRPDIV